MYARNAAGVVELQADDQGQLKLASSTHGEYRISDLDTGGSKEYYGYTDKDGNWYILELTAATARYCKGKGDYATHWGKRNTELIYDYFYNVFQN